jgi:hypothetical protein
VLINKINGKSFYYGVSHTKSNVKEIPRRTVLLNAIIIIWQMVIYTQAPLFTAVEKTRLQGEARRNKNSTSSIERGGLKRLSQMTLFAHQ